MNISREENLDVLRNSVLMGTAAHASPGTKTSDSQLDFTIATRIRPLNSSELENGLFNSAGISPSKCAVDVHELRVKVNGKPTIDISSFQLDRAYGPNNDSEELFEDLAAPLVPWAWEGGVSTLFAYGQTGSGKTFTINALERLAAQKLFSNLGGRRDIYVSIFELQGNIASDLLNERRRINILDDAFGEIQVVGALEPLVSSAPELISIIEKSMALRRTETTASNESSSRSHAICRLRIVNKDILDTPDGLLFVIDLAGSEAASDTCDHSAARMKEAREINSSLSTLKDCIRGRLQSAASELTGGRGKRNVVHIPNRNSALTKVLKHVFDIKGMRHCKTAVIACVNPSYLNSGPTKNTLRYAEMLRVPVPAYKARKYSAMVPATWSNTNLAEWIKTNSGDTPIDPQQLAPAENGIQLCRLPKGEFVTRCLKTSGVTEEHARAFYDKIWRLHIDSRKVVDGKVQMKINDNRADVPEEKKVLVPFTERLRPGMFVQKKYSSQADGIISRFVILAPEGAFSDTEGANSETGEVLKTRKVGEAKSKGKRYTCALVLPSPMGDAYEIDIANQMTVGVEEMEKEIFAEYDFASRCYFMNI